MHIVVCIKQVPDSAQIRVHPVTNTIMRQGVPTIINPYDLFALEEAMRLRDKVGGEVTVLTMGPPSAEDSLRKALTFGADRAVLLTDRFFAGADTLATSYALAAAIRKIGATFGPVDIVFTGKQTIDGDTAQVGPGICQAAELSSAHLCLQDRRNRSRGPHHRGRAPLGRRRAGAALDAALPDHHARRHQRDAPRLDDECAARRARHRRQVERAGRRRRRHRQMRSARLAHRGEARVRADRRAPKRPRWSSPAGRPPADALIEEIFKRQPEARSTTCSNSRVVSERL